LLAVGGRRTCWVVDRAVGREEVVLVVGDHVLLAGTARDQISLAVIGVYGVVAVTTIGILIRIGGNDGGIP
jgi:hypothetical protein